MIFSFSLPSLPVRPVKLEMMYERCGAAWFKIEGLTEALMSKVSNLNNKNGFLMDREAAHESKFFTSW